jgi:3',5'-cyclic AMP phosphodiesterase CpdA
MKKYLFVFFLLLFEFHFALFATEPFRFALFSDTHISPTNPQPTEDLQNAVNDVNLQKNIDFVLVSGDVSNLGDTASLNVAKKLFQKLKMPYYVIPGNHDVKWYETGATNFNSVFKDNKFTFSHKGFVFIGFTTAPLTNSAVGIIQQTDIDWIKTVLERTGTKTPVFVITHYPLLPGDVDNGKVLIDILLKYNVKAVLNGHYHRNVLLNYNGIPGIVNRSTLRATNPVGGYSLYTISDSIQVSEKRIGEPEEVWLAFPINSIK